MKQFDLKDIRIQVFRIPVTGYPSTLRIFFNSSGCVIEMTIKQSYLSALLSFMEGECCVAAKISYLKDFIIKQTRLLVKENSE